MQPVDESLFVETWEKSKDLAMSHKMLSETLFKKVHQCNYANYWIVKLPASEAQREIVCSRNRRRERVEREREREMERGRKCKKEEQNVVEWTSAMKLTHITWSSSVFAFQSQFVCAKMQLSYWPSGKYSWCENHILWSVGIPKAIYDLIVRKDLRQYKHFLSFGPNLHFETIYRRSK